MSKLVLRDAIATRDASVCADIYRPFVTESWVSFETDPPDSKEMARRISEYGQSHTWLVAESDGIVVGYAYGSPHRSRAAYASSCDVAVYLAARARGKGVGRVLYAELLTRLSASYHAAFAGITLPNNASVGLHQAMGFEPVGIYRQVGWKLGDWRDVGWWQKVL